MDGGVRISTTLLRDFQCVLPSFEKFGLPGLLSPAYCGGEMAAGFLGIILEDKELYDVHCLH
jgi:hypothetical protein